jgi:hypothetical protein
MRKVRCSEDSDDIRSLKIVVYLKLNLEVAMNAIRVIFAMLVAMTLQGCASMGEKAGFVPNTDTVSVRQEPWLANSIPGNIGEEFGYKVVPVVLPQPVSNDWKRELVDPTRSYMVEVGGGKNEKPLERVVFRGMEYNSSGRLVSVHPAVVNESATALFVLMPYGRETTTEHHLYIASAMGRWLMTTTGVHIAIGEGESLMQLRDGLVKKFPSLLPAPVLIGRGDDYGVKFMEDLEERFPWRFAVAGKVYSGRPEGELRKIANFTREEDPFDCFVSRGSVKLSPGMTTVGLVVAVPVNLYRMRLCNQ